MPKQITPIAVPIPRLETERLILREWQHGDLEPYADFVANEEMMRYLGGQTTDRSGAWRQIATLVGHWAMRGHGFWALEEKETGDFVGRVGVWEPEGWPATEVGWSIMPQHHRKGFAAEAGYASAKWGFETLGLESIISVIHPDNVASIGVAKKIGETFDHTTELLGMPVHIYKVAKGDLIKP